MRIVSVICLFFLTVFAPAQENGFRGSIPEELLRPGYGESPRYPIDTVIGELGRGEASDAAYLFANSVAAGFVSGEMGHSGLRTVNAALRENYFSVLRVIEPGGYRLGSGREEADGSVSFLVRFLGREKGITGELFIRFVTRQVRGEDPAETAGMEAAMTGNWVFEDLLLEEARSRDEQQRESLQRFDFSPYERFF
jgi:hypothetical protein